MTAYSKGNMYPRDEGQKIDSVYPGLERRSGSGQFVIDSLLVGYRYGNIELPKDQLKEVCVERKSKYFIFKEILVEWLYNWS